MLKEREDACRQKVKYASYSHMKERPYGLIPYISFFLKKTFCGLFSIWSECVP